MFGFFIGTISLLGLMAVLRRQMWRYGHRGHRRGFGRGFGGSFGPGFGPRAMLRGLFTRLDTSPGQEKAIAEAIADLTAQAKDARGGLDGARHEVAEALRQEAFDEVLLGGALTRLDDSMDVLRKGALDAFGKVHAALDDRQRKILADMIESGRRPFFGSPYRI